MIMLSNSRMLSVLVVTGMCMNLVAAHVEPGTTIFDEATALVLDGGMTHEKYLEMSYGNLASEMLDAAFEARAAMYIEDTDVIRHLANNDIRNVPCYEPNAKTKASYIKVFKYMKNAAFKPDMTIPVSGKMYGVTNAFENLVFQMNQRTGLEIRIRGDMGKYTGLDAQEKSYSFWPLGVAIHSRDAYAEEVSHFFNFCAPNYRIVRYAGAWSSPDYATVSDWNEFIAAYHGIKVHALSLGINLNDSHITYENVTDDNGETQTVPKIGVAKFDTYFAAVKDSLDGWITNGKSPIPTNSVVLLLAAREALSHVATPQYSKADDRFLNLCRNFNVSRMVL